VKPSGLHVDQVDDQDVRVVNLGGWLDLPGAAVVLKAVRGCGDIGPKVVVFDLAGLVEPVEPHLMVVFPAAQRCIGCWPEREVRLAGASAPVLRDLHRLHLDRFVTLDATLPSALHQVRTRRHAVRRTHSMTAVPSSAAQARYCIDDLMAAAPDDVREAAELVASELASNALRHVCEPFTFSLALTDDELLVAVTDADRQTPTVRPFTADAEGGRGLHLVESLSTSWGVRLIYRGGKTVWSRIATVPGAPTRGA
jgi:hypothetical protein